MWRSPDGTVVDTRTPVLVIVDRGGAGRLDRLGSRLLPSTRVRVVGAARAGHGRAETGSRPCCGCGAVAAPVVVEEPTRGAAARGAIACGAAGGDRRAGADARALLPGLVVGDTSRVPPELDEAFKATDLTHLLAVSGANFTILLALLIGPPGLAQQAERRGLAPRLGHSAAGDRAGSAAR